MDRHTVLPATSIPVLVLLVLGMYACGSSHHGGGAEPLSCDDPCHGLPPDSGAHDTHVQALDVTAEVVSCDVCHGAGAVTGTHAGHQDSTVTLLGDASYSAVCLTLPSWFGSTWGRPAVYGTPYSAVDGTGDYSCVNLRCHGGGTVGWVEQARSRYYNRVCLGCHDITPAEFALPGAGGMRRASNAAANYEGPISGWGRGGHGDTAISNPLWFSDSAHGSTLPLACFSCHDGGSPHFPPSSDNPYRMWRLALRNGLPGADPQESLVTNLCTQTDCHPKVLGGGDHGFLTRIKHPNDFWPLGDPEERPIMIPLGSGATPPILVESATSSTTDPCYDPAGIARSVGLHVDRFVDHWGWWNPSASATADTVDDRPFLPLGDSLAKGAGDLFDNGEDLLITCVTCHNPHGTDLAVAGEEPGLFNTQAMVPDNKMLRLRDSDTELCAACH